MARLEALADVWAAGAESLVVSPEQLAAERGYVLLAGDVIVLYVLRPAVQVPPGWTPMPASPGMAFYRLWDGRESLETTLRAEIRREQGWAVSVGVGQS
jgi:hypothetical protein